MGAYVYGTHFTTKGLLGIFLVVGGSFSYAMERIQRSNAEECELDRKQLLEKKQNESVIVKVTDDERSEPK